MLKVTNVKKYFIKRNTVFGKGNIIKAVDDVSFSIPEGKTFGLVGESGSGKSTIAKMVTGIVKRDAGEIKVGGSCDIVFQDPYSSLNPRMKVKNIIGEPLLIKGVEKREIKERVMGTLTLVKLEAAIAAEKYPHQFSGGERQRIAIARAIIRHPNLLILDEPVSSLDVSIQAGILNLLKDLQERFFITYLFISHDLRVVEFMSDDIGVMKQGKLVEVAEKTAIYKSPKSEYTRQLLNAIPSL